MKAIAFERFGDASVLSSVDVPRPKVERHQVLVKIAYTSVNPVDWKIREGYLKDLFPHQFPVIPGWDASGIIEEVGGGVTRFSPGDCVYAYTRKAKVGEGTYAEYIALDETSVALAPKSISLDAAAGLPLVALTAWQALFDNIRLKNGETLFVAGGAGGVGSIAIQLAKSIGAKVVTTASSSNHDYLKRLGADVVIDYRHQDVVDSILSTTPSGVDAVLDAVGGASLKEAWAIVKNGGRLVSIVDTPDSAEAKSKNVEASFVFVAPHALQLEKIAELIDQGKMMVPEFSVGSVRDAAQYQIENAQRHVRGKKVLKIDFAEAGV